MKKHYKPMYVGTQAERIAETLSLDSFGSMWWETDTNKWYKWNGTIWERYYTELELQTSGGAQVHWDNLTNVPQLFEANFYPHDVASGISTYSKLLTDPPAGAEEIDTAVCNAAGGEVLLDAYITEVLNSILLQGGTWHFFNWNKVDNVTGVTQMVIRVYKRSSVGVETELFNVTTVEINNTSVDATAVEVMSIRPDFVIASTDRLLVKYFAKTTSVANRTVSFYHDGTAHYSHIHTPFDMISVASGGSSGVSIAFTSLIDVPSSYAGKAGKAVTVLATEAGLEFTTPSATVATLDAIGDVSVPAPTDGKLLGYVGSVGLWEAVATPTGVPSMFPITTPNDALFSWVNQSTASITAVAEGLALYVPASASMSIRIREYAAPSTPYTITAAFKMTGYPSNYHFMSFGFKEAASGKLVHWRFGWNNAWVGGVIRSSNPTTDATEQQSFGSNGVNYFLRFVRIRDDGTSIYFDHSYDGRYYSLVYTELRGAYMTSPAFVFWGGDSRNSKDAYVTLLSWLQS